MEKEEMLDKVLAMLSGDMDDIEGRGAMEHSMDECPDPLGCTMHDGEHGDSLSGLAAGDKSPAAVTLEVKKGGLPSMEGELGDGEKAEDGLDPDTLDALKKLLK
jgi:hypothetical protein